MAKISFENLYRKIVSGFNDNPPESVWQNIQDDLDIDEVWSQLDSQLPSTPAATSYSPVRQIINYALFFLLIFFFKSNSDQQLLPLNSTPNNSQESLIVEENIEKDFNSENEKNENLLAVKKEIENTESNSIKEVAQNKTATQNKTSDDNKATQNLDINNTNIEEMTADVIETEDIVDTDNDVTYFTTLDSQLNYLDSRPANFEAIIKTTLPEPFPIDSISSTDSSENKIPFIKFSSIGIVGNMKNSWIINNATKASFNNESLINTEITYTNDFGVSSQFIIRTQQIIQLSYWFSARNTQNYYQYYNANYSKKEFTMAYQSFSIDLLQPLFSTDNYLIIGFQLAKIGSVKETLAGDFSDLSNNYSDWNYGIDLGLQKKFEIHQKISFQPAIRFHYGLSNIFTGNEFIPREFDYTRPASISLDLRFFYHFIK